MPMYFYLIHSNIYLHKHFEYKEKFTSSAFFVRKVFSFSLTHSIAHSEASQKFAFFIIWLHCEFIVMAKMQMYLFSTFELESSSLR